MASFAKYKVKVKDSFQNGKWSYKLEIRIIEIIAKGQGWAMVKNNKEKTPFVIREKELFLI